MKIAVAVILGALALALSGCGKSGSPSQLSSPAGPLPSTASAPPQAGTPTPEQPQPAAAPSHNYAMVDNGTYGYEPGLSEDDIRKGVATKALVMMRYEGNKNGTFTILILGEDANNANTVNRISCQAPCQFAKSETVVGDEVVSTETIPVTPDSLMGGMLQDAVSGQLKAYGQGSGAAHIAMPAQPVQVAATPSQPAPQVGSSGPADMWIGPNDMNLRSCPGTTCAPIAVVPKNSKATADTASIRNVTETSGAQTPWVQITYSGPTCDPAALDPKVGCVSPHDSGAPVTGWVNYRRLASAAPAGQ